MTECSFARNSKLSSRLTAGARVSHATVSFLAVYLSVIVYRCGKPGPSRTSELGATETQQQVWHSRISQGIVTLQRAAGCARGQRTGRSGYTLSVDRLGATIARVDISTDGDHSRLSQRALNYATFDALGDMATSDPNSPWFGSQSGSRTRSRVRLGDGNGGRSSPCPERESFVGTLVGLSHRPPTPWFLASR